MSEELEDASIQLPRAMMLATVLNGVLGIAMMITFCFCILDIDQVVGDGASQFPVMQIVLAATESYAATCVLGALLVVLLFFSTVTTVASASRQIWAFSRDNVRTPSIQAMTLLLTHA
jgi:amino acid transporter